MDDILSIPLLDSAFYQKEEDAITALVKDFPLTAEERDHIVKSASAVIERSRSLKDEQGPLDALLAEFGLSNQEGVALMCLAEALLRIPDAATRDALIAEKIRAGDWQTHIGKSDNLFVNASSWALMLTGHVIALDQDIQHSPWTFLKSLIARFGEPVIRRAVMSAMKVIGKGFVFGRDMNDALKRQQRLQKTEKTGKIIHSFDMLGEGARTMAAAERYLSLYQSAIMAVGEHNKKTQDPRPLMKAEKSDEGLSYSGNIHDRSSISIKLSALHPRYDEANRTRVMSELLPHIKLLAQAARAYDMQLTIDAEESDRLRLQLDILAALAHDEDLKGWQGLGIAVQAYQKRAPFVIDYLVDLARQTGRVFAVRLVKGAYWDSEIKQAQMLGYKDYPVWTRKASTDICYLYCAARMLAAPDALYPQFATHNAHTIAAVMAMVQPEQPFEFQRLHGMGALLYRAANDIYCKQAPQGLKIRVYAPVGEHEDLLPYLVRRLLENGANSSFINRFMNAAVPASIVAADPINSLQGAKSLRHSLIPLPAHLYGSDRLNSKGYNLMNQPEYTEIAKALEAKSGHSYEAYCLINGERRGAGALDVLNPSNILEKIGEEHRAELIDLDEALESAAGAAHRFNQLGGKARAIILRRAADLLEENRDTLFDLLVREAGKTLNDCIAELREAVDFCRYYAKEAEAKFSEPILLPGPTGETNKLYLQGRGVFLCISPWNFPLAIFTGQIMAALASGNSVIAKPAEQTPLIAHFAVELFHKAGVPVDCLHLLLGDGVSVGGPLVADARISGVAFTGSTDTARIINRQLAARDGAIIPLIAETGGLNAMLVDSTALSEQVVDDVLNSAFGSAGQRCSALRILCLQDSIADRVTEMLIGALQERVVGNPSLLETDIGPIIDRESCDRLTGYCAHMIQNARLLAKADIKAVTREGYYLPPHIFEIDSLEQLQGEQFGPILHILRFPIERLDQTMADLSQMGYGLTFGLHSRLEERATHIAASAPAGNVYVNRNMIGAVVGVQPFGGEGLSGTGPKAGGPHYLLRFASERTVTINTAAAGGNTALFTMQEE